MILEKLFDAFYEEASRYITKWRIAIFLSSWLIVAETIEIMLKSGFWTSSLADSGTALVSSLTGIPLYKLMFLALTAFYLGPMIANKSAFLLLKWQMTYADNLFIAVDSAVAQTPLDGAGAQLAVARDAAVQAEKKIGHKKALNECYVTILLLSGAFFFGMSYAPQILVASVFVWIWLAYGLVQKMLILYVSKIYHFKLLSAKASAEMLASSSVDRN